MAFRPSLYLFLLFLLIAPIKTAAQELYVEPLKKITTAAPSITTAKLSLKGDLLAVAGVDKVIKIIDTKTLQEKATFVTRNPGIFSLAFTSEGKYLISGGADGFIDLWSAPEGLLIRETPAYGNGIGVRSVDIDQGKKIVSGGGNGDIKLWTQGSNDILGMLPKGVDESEVLSVAFDPGGKFVAAANADGAVRIFDPQTYLLVKQLIDHGAAAGALAFSPNGKYLAAAGADSTIRVWDAQDFSLFRTLRLNAGGITSLSFNPNNTWLASAAGKIYVWDISSGALRKTISDSSAVFAAAIFLPDSSTLCAAAASGMVETFTILARKPDREPPTFVLQQPLLKEGEILKIFASEFEFKGLVADESGVKEVKVAGQPAALTDPAADEKSQLAVKGPAKKFSKIVQLPAVGINDITVAATDERGNTSTKTVHIQRLTKEAALEILDPKNNAETDQASLSLQFKTWFDYTRYTITLNTIEITNKENIPRKALGVLQVEPIPLSSGFNQIQIAVYGKGGEKISKIINVTRRVLTAPVSAQADKPARTASNQPQQWAVVIGISEYSNPTIKNLNYADRDARDFADFLQSPAGGGFEPERMKILLNKDATLQNIKQALYNFLRQTIDKDQVVIYFAGHGAPEPANPSNNYLLTYDTDPNSLETTAFPMWDVNTALTRYIPSRRVIVFSDACHSGGISSDLATRGVSLTETNLINQYLADLAKSKEGTIVFTASQAGEVSQELDKFGHGVFTYYLLKGLKGEADVNNDYTVTIGELMDYVEENVKRQTKGNQHPTRNQGTYDKDMTISLISSLNIHPSRMRTLAPHSIDYCTKGKQ